MIYGGPLRGAIDGGVLRKGYHCEILTGEATMHSHLPIVSQDTKMGRDYLVNQSLESGAAKPYPIQSVAKGLSSCTSL